MFNFKQLLSPQAYLTNIVRSASKKTKNPKKNRIKKQDGEWVESGTMLIVQRTLRLHPGLNVGMGRNGNLYAKIPGTVVITCEKTDPNWDHKWIQRHYCERNHTNFYKKYFNVIPKPQHQNFKLIEQI